MRSKNLLPKLAAGLLFLAAALGVAAQKTPGRGPKQEKLLNGLKLLMWSDPSADKVTVKIRVHSGSAFDPQGKEGVMKLLADNIFPTAEARDYFRDDLGGSLDVTSNYDYIQITASSKPSEFLTMLDTLATAVANPTIDKETTQKLKASLLDAIAEKERDPAYIADQAAAKRLFGTFPYGRPQIGTAESVKQIDFADLRFAKDRFFGADNATMTISGNFDPDTAFRAVRRYFGSWLKSDKKVPSTFRQPDEPDTKPLEITVPASGENLVRFAFRGVARSDKDYAASVVLSKILQARLSQSGAKAAVTNEAMILPGVVLIGFRGDATSLPPTLFSAKITDAEFAAARAAAAAESAARPVDELWLDADTYRIDPAADAQALQSVTAADVQRVADRLGKNTVATVVMKPAGN